MAARRSASVTTIQCQPWRLLPDGAWSAISRHSRTSSIGTGRVRSRRLRTERVVVSSSSGVRVGTDMGTMLPPLLAASVVAAVPRAGDGERDAGFVDVEEHRLPVGGEAHPGQLAVRRLFGRAVVHAVTGEVEDLAVAGGAQHVRVADAVLAHHQAAVR